MTITQKRSSGSSRSRSPELLDFLDIEGLTSDEYEYNEDGNAIR